MAAVIGRGVPKFSVFGSPVTNCFLLMDECPGGQIVLAGDTKGLLPQVLTRDICIKTNPLNSMDATVYVWFMGQIFVYKCQT